EDRQTDHRFNAACAAARAGCGEGEDKPADAAALSELRRQAFDWLRADLAAKSKELETASPPNRVAVIQTLQNWKTHNALACVRDEKEWAKLPEGERKEWQTFWAEVDAPFQQADGRLAAVLQGKEQPKDAGAWLELAAFCSKVHNRYATSTEL